MQPLYFKFSTLDVSAECEDLRAGNGWIRREKKRLYAFQSMGIFRCWRKGKFNSSKTWLRPLYLFFLSSGTNVFSSFPDVFPYLFLGSTMPQDTNGKSVCLCRHLWTSTFKEDWSCHSQRRRSVHRLSCFQFLLRVSTDSCSLHAAMKDRCLCLQLRFTLFFREWNYVFRGTFSEHRQVFTTAETLAFVIYFRVYFP